MPPPAEPAVRPEAGRLADTVRSEVLSLLGRSPAFRELSPAAQAEMRENMAKVGAFLAERPDEATGAPARALEKEPPPPVERLKARLAEDPGQVGQDFKAGAVREGVEQFGELVAKVDFAKFVGGLIQNVFQAVVDASIQQMRAYAELLAATAKSVDQFAADHITDAQARDHLASRYPSLVRVDTAGEGPARLRPLDDAEGADGIARDFGLPGAVDLENDDDEEKLVAAAKRDMARSRQQLLSTMVLLGINRIVVTKGQINAKVVFDMRASDQARRQSQAELHDRETSAAAVGGWLPIGFGFGASKTHETTVSSAVDDTSEAKAAVKAQLSGDVKLSFKSETFPLERMVDVMGMQQLNEKAAPGGGASGAPTR